MSKYLVPQIPKAIQLPADPTMTWEQLFAKDATIRVFENTQFDMNIEEKVDGASCAMSLVDEHPVIRNKDRIMKKGEVGESMAKKQFASIWTWFYDNHRKFRKLYGQIGPSTVYGEWMVMQHGIFYDRLPAWFIAFDVFSHETYSYIPPLIARGALIEAGFSVSWKLNYTTTSPSYAELVALTEGPSQFTDKDGREGIFIKLSDQKHVIHRFKIVRSGFKRGALFSSDKLYKNKLGEPKSFADSVVRTAVSIV